MKKDNLLQLESKNIIGESDVSSAYIRTDFVCDVSGIIKKACKDSANVRKYTIQQAVADKDVAPKLRTIVTKHPPEWLPIDKDEKIKTRLEEPPYMWPPEKYNAYKELYFQKLAFWDQLKDNTDDGRDGWQKQASVGSSFPDEVYFFHPIKFIEHLKRISYQPYGGYTLREGDKDSEKKWGGSVQSNEGTFVRELQKDLVKLGYWISSPTSNYGMLVDGVFGNNVKGGVCTFQKEHKLAIDGYVGQNTAKKIKECIKSSNFTRPGFATTNYGKFYQLLPSKEKHYSRYLASYDEDQIMKDCWGTKKTLKVIVDTAKSWNEDGKSILKIGDISLYAGGNFPPHGSHKDGKGVDIKSEREIYDQSGPDKEFVDIRSDKFKKEEALELCNKLVQKGAKRILFNCAYVIDKCTEVTACKNHHHHMHMDSITKSIPIPGQDSYKCKHCSKTVYDACDYTNKVSGLSDSDLTL